MSTPDSTLVRPKDFQKPDRIAIGSPLAIQGIFLEILRARFIETSGLMWVWRPDITLSDIVIEAGYNEETESRNTVPALYINRLRSTPQKMVVGDRVGVRLKDHLEGYGAIEEVVLSIDCVSADEGASAILGDTVQFTLLAAQDVIQRTYGLHDFSHPILNQTLPYEKDKTKWNTQVSFTIQFWIRWLQVPIAPLLQQVTQRINLKNTTASEYFVDTVLNSLKRGDVFDPAVLKEGEALPPSRISIVGPQGAPGLPGRNGDPGPQGPRGLSGITDTEHEVLHQLIHFIDSGPAHGFASNAYKETLPSGSFFPTSIIWWESSAKLKKLVEKIITRTGGGATLIAPTPIEWKMYGTDGITVVGAVSDDVTYSGVVETSRTRTIS